MSIATASAIVGLFCMLGLFYETFSYDHTLMALLPDAVPLWVIIIRTAFFDDAMKSSNPIKNFR